MGVHGLWKLIEPSGQMVPLESLAGKVLAVDVSIWLHQAIKGMHDAHGAPVAVAHLLILFHRLCKLLFYKIKPVFVFDGGVPALKRQTMVARRQQTNVAKSEMLKVREKLIKNLLKHEAVRQILQNETASAALGLNSFTLPGPSIEEDLYKLPPIATENADSESSEDITSSEEDERHTEDIHSVDVSSKEFLSLPPEVRHDILTELIDTRKQSSWKNLDNMPKESNSFSDFQMTRLLKRHAVQTSLEKAGKEMGGRALSLKELESLLGDQGILDVKMDLPSKRIAQDSVTHYMLIQNSNNESNSEITEVKIDQKETDSTKKFNIMNHLEDVEWSSESDTDIILNKSSNENKDKSLLNQESQGVEKESCSVGPSLLSKETKVRMTDEIASILTILEDNNDDTASEMKAKLQSLQNQVVSNYDYKNKMDFKEDTESEIVNCKLDSSNLAEETIQPTVKLTEEKKGTSPTASLSSESHSNYVYENYSKQKSKEIQNTNSKEIFEKCDEVKLDVKKEDNTSENVSATIDTREPYKIILKNADSLNSLKKVEDISSSSDSENDLIPISVPEAENFSSNIVENETLKPISDVSREKISESSNTLIVTVNPSKMNDSEDLFADIFLPTSTSDIKNSDQKIIDFENDQIANNEIIDDDSVIQNKPFGNISGSKDQISNEDLNYFQKQLEGKQYDLLMEQGKQERLALNPSDQMYSDAQELLKLFGIPFVIAPMEAEAQCATLNMIGLTEGTITDDSDIWLFGGRVVYKNFFNQKKHVLEYKSENIQKYFKLSREDLIKIAMLVGSDYTVGLNGIGPVTALEILANFQSTNKNDLLESLHKFCDWFTGRNKSGPTRAGLKKKIRNTVISPGFPNRAVVEAYLHPLVDDSKEPFSWAEPNVDLIRKYAKIKMGWSPEKCNELLIPVIKKLQTDTSQSVLEKYFTMVQKPLNEGAMSKRVEKAVKQLGNECMEEETNECLVPKKRRKSTKLKINKILKDNEEAGESESSTSEKNTKHNKNSESNVQLKNIYSSQTSKTRLINERLYQEIKIPQKEMTQKLLQKRKKEAIEIFRTYKKGKRKTVKVFAKEDANLSESSSDEN